MSLTLLTEGVWKYVGPKEGPTICLIGGTHGNEETGIEVVKQFVQMAEKGDLVLDAGVLYFILGNPRAIERGARGSDDHQDLNRVFTRDVLTRPLDGTYEDERAKELAPILAQATISIDIHATNKPSVPMLCCNITPRHERVYRWFICDTILADPDYVLGGKPCTTDEFVDLAGGVGICYESGQAGDMTRVSELIESIKNMLRDQQMLLDQGVSDPPKINHHEYSLAQAIFLTEEGFTFVQGKGQSSFESFAEGEVLGHVGDQPFVAPFDGVFAFPKVIDHWKIGSPVCYLARKR